MIRDALWTITAAMPSLCGWLLLLAVLGTLFGRELRAVFRGWWYG